MQRRYAIIKNNDNKEITYIEYVPKKGYGVIPKNHYSTGEMIKVNEMVIINPTLIQKLINKKCQRTLKKIIDLLSTMDENGDVGGGFSGLILDEIAHFESLLEGKYQAYMEKEAYEVMLKKIQILKMEVEIRRSNYQYYYEEEKESRGSR